MDTLDKPDSSDVLCGLASLIVPGAGQLLQGRPWVGIGLFLLAAWLWLAYAGWIVHIVAAVTAARYHPKRARADRLRQEQRQQLIRRIRSRGSSTHSNDRV